METSIAEPRVENVTEAHATCATKQIFAKPMSPKNSVPIEDPETSLLALDSVLLLVMGGMALFFVVAIFLLAH